MPRRVMFLALSIIILVSALIRFNRLDEPIGGYHAMNEAQYVIIARNFSHGSFLRPTGYDNRVDIKIRALYVYAVYGAFRIFGETPAAARAVSAASGVAAVLLMFLIGNLLAGPRSGIACSALLAFSPIHATLSRNAQPDALCVALCLLCVWLYLKSVSDARKTLFLVLSGISWGAAVFTKNFALLLFPCVVINELSDIRSIRTLFLRIALFVAPAALIVSPFLVYQLSTNPHGTAAAYREILLKAPDSMMLKYMLHESFWALSPPVFVGAVLSFAILPFAGFKKMLFPWLATAAFCFQYFFQHVHSYYFLSAAPFLTLLAGVGMARLRRNVSTPAISIAAAFSLLFTLMITAAIKTNQSNFFDSANTIKNESPAGTVVASSMVFNNYAPVLRYYLPGFAIFEKEKFNDIDAGTGLLRIPGARPVFLVDFYSGKPGINPAFQSIVDQKLYGLCVRGRAFYVLPISPHSFIPAKFGAAALPPGTCPLYGYAPFAKARSILVSRVPAGDNIYLRRDKYGASWFVIE